MHNGSAGDFGSLSEGSIPSSPANFMNTLKSYIDNATNIVAFTGAGISTESGIPDFRSVGGLYTSGPFEGMEPEDILSRRTLRKDPALLSLFYKERLLKLVDKEPNRAHFALAKLEEQGKLKAVVTQNIDGLHVKAGSKKVLELHGTCKSFRCTNGCKYTFDISQYLGLFNDKGIPKCPICTFGTIRPNTVLFDEWLDDVVFETAQKAIAECDLLIAIGSSLQVMPACNLLLDRNPQCKLVIINNTPTAFDKFAALVLRESCGQVLEESII